MENEIKNEIKTATVGKSKGTAIFFAITLGYLGIHSFYLARPLIGILQIITFFSIPFLQIDIALIIFAICFITWIASFLSLIAMTDKEFNFKYNFDR